MGRRETTFETGLAAVAARQAGYLTTAQARAAGCSQKVVSRRLANGLWVAVHRGVYRVAAVPPSWRGDVLAATLAAGERAVCSHATAAALLGLERVATREPIEISVTGSALPLLAAVRVHRTRSLEPCDVTEVDGIRVTTAARTLIDLAARFDRTQLLASVDDAICARLTSRQWLHRRASALQAGRHGVARLARLTDDGAEGVFRSWLERRAGQLWAAANLPQPRWNVEVVTPSGRRYVVDALFPSRLITELEGLRFHTAPQQRRDDAARFNDLILAGHCVLRFTWRDIVEDGERVVAEIRDALAARGVWS